MTKKVVAGVPLNAYLANSRNGLMPEVSQERGSGIRIFVQCMELKGEGVSPTSKRQCEALQNGLARR